jgi:hypothetical protein
MTTVPTPTPGGEIPGAAPVPPTEGERNRLREFLASQQRLWSQAEVQLLEQVEQLIDQASAGRQTPGAAADAAAAQQECNARRGGEVETLKTRIVELERQLGQAQSSGRASAGGVLNWEAEKRRILAALELETSDDDEAAAGRRMKVEEVIDTTDAIVSEKQREVEELQGLLASQSRNLDSVAVGAAALGKSLDQDAIIRQERETLKQLQEQWRAKLRQAEIEVSLERAQIARQKAELDARCRALALPPATPDAQSGTLGDRPVRGQWLARLGLKSPPEP